MKKIIFICLTILCFNSCYYRNEETQKVTGTWKMKSYKENGIELLGLTLFDTNTAGTKCGFTIKVIEFDKFNEYTFVFDETGKFYRKRKDKHHKVDRSYTGGFCVLKYYDYEDSTTYDATWEFIKRQEKLSIAFPSIFNKEFDIIYLNNNEMKLSATIDKIYYEFLLYKV